MKNLFYLIFGSGSNRVKVILRVLIFFKNTGFHLLSKLTTVYLERSYGLYLHPKVAINETLKFPHPTSIVIGAGTIIGDNVTIYQNVTIGGARIGDAKKNNYPVIGNNVVIFAGAVLIGKIVIGNNAIVGANSVVNINVPDDHIAVGVPCRIKKK